MPMLTIQEQPLPYIAKLPERTAEAVTLAVIHCTELPDLATAREYGEKVLYESGTGNSGHYYIDRDGEVYRYVPATRVANHVRGYNPQSIGIELVNKGRYPHWFDARHQSMAEPYTGPQITSLRMLLTQLQREYPNLSDVAGHQDLDLARVPASDDPGRQVPRKLDPGPLFPWTEVLAGSTLKRIFADH